MFLVDRPNNRLHRLDQMRFSDLHLHERSHLQEWLVHMPNALGEKLLIIQKEFSGFDGTNERLDLLALDKDAQLVVIENKIDDSGRDVTWQALKYAAYVSSLTKSQIIDIYQQYLDRRPDGGNAVQRICDFLEVEELDEVVLNQGNDQRIMFVAGNFRKEVTSTVLWLREHQIDARCFKVELYAHNDETFADIQPVIPTPEAADFMISMADKETEARSAQGAQRTSHLIRKEYWTLALEGLREADVALYQNISPTTDHWLSAGSGLAFCRYAMIFLKRGLRVEFSFDRPTAEENKWLFDSIYRRREEVEESFGDRLEWLRLDDKKASRIQFGHSCESYLRENWPDYVKWHVEHIQKLERALREPLGELNQALRARGAPG